MTHSIVRGAAALAVSAMLVACGGAGGGGPAAETAGEPAPVGSGAPAPSTAAVPDASFGSWGAMLAFLKALVADESGEPLVVPKAGPTDDGAEPSPTS